jgi:hypothetical protein
MSVFVSKIIEEKGQQIKKETIEDINRVAVKATERFEKVIEQLIAQAKIILPVNIIDILAKGGEARITEFNVRYQEEVRVQIGPEYPFYEQPIRLKDGKYRLILIVDKLGPPEPPPEPRKDC